MFNEAGSHSVVGVHAATFVGVRPVADVHPVEGADAQPVARADRHSIDGFNGSSWTPIGRKPHSRFEFARSFPEGVCPTFGVMHMHFKEEFVNAFRDRNGVLRRDDVIKKWKRVGPSFPPLNSDIRGQYDHHKPSIFRDETAHPLDSHISVGCSLWI